MKCLIKKLLFLILFLYSRSFFSQDFEVSSLMVEYEFTEYDHGGLISGASKASGKK